jgi:uncharacterized protein YwgA
LPRKADATNPAQQLTVILALAAELRDRGTRFGNTHLVKGLFLLRELLRVPLPFVYKISYYGPYSDEVQSKIRVLVDIGALEQHRPRGQAEGHYVLASQSPIGSSGSDATAAYERQIEFVAQSIARWDRTWLEAVLTTLWFRNLHPNETPAEISSRVREIKNHISKERALEAACRLDRLIERARAQGLLVGVAAPAQYAGQEADPVDPRLPPGPGIPSEFDSPPPAEHVPFPPQEPGSEWPSLAAPPKSRVVIRGASLETGQALSAALASVGLRACSLRRETVGVSLGGDALDRALAGADAILEVVPLDRAEVTAETATASHDDQIELFPAGSLTAGPAGASGTEDEFEHKTIRVAPPSVAEPPDLPPPDLVRLGDTPDHLHALLQRLDALGLPVNWDGAWWDAYLCGSCEPPGW